MSELINSIVSTDEIAKLSIVIRERTLKRIQTIPAGFMNWRLNNTALSFAHIIQHLINVDELFLQMMQSDPKKYVWVMGTDEPHKDYDKESCQTLIAKIKKLQNERAKVIQSLEKSDLNEEVFDEKGEKMTLWWFMMRKLIEHEVYHRGQMSVYLKLLKGESMKS
jgi:uncharacterized damage-inducible protein DinB